MAWSRLQQYLSVWRRPAVDAHGWAAGAGGDPRDEISRSGLFDHAWYCATFIGYDVPFTAAVEHYLRTHGHGREQPNALFDGAFYAASYPDADGQQPLLHYLRVGRHARRNPGPLFDAVRYAGAEPALTPDDDALAFFLGRASVTGPSPHALFDVRWYLSRNPDVAAAGVNPLLHFMRSGAAEGRDPHPLFDVRWYLSRNPDVAAARVNPLVHFVRSGATEGRDPHPLFDVKGYLSRNPDVAAAGVNPLVHFLDAGAREGRDPHSLFDTSWYVARYPAAATDQTSPLGHFVQAGAGAGLDPHPTFDSRWYLSHYVDVARSGINPLIHFVMHGAGEGRRTRGGIAPPRPGRGRQWRPQPGAGLGVNFIGPVDCLNGLGTSARGYVAALHAAGIECNVVPWQIGFEHVPAGPPRAWPRAPVQAINLIHLNLDLLTQVDLIRRSVLPGLVTQDTYNIAIAYWELASIAPEWAPMIGRLDEIWCASRFTAAAFEAVSSKPVRVVRPALDMSRTAPVRARRHLGVPEHAFVYGYMIDALSGLARKNPLTLLEAYAAEFSPDEGTACVLKIGAAPADHPVVQAMRALAGRRPDIILIERTLSEDEVSDLHHLTDCYVSPHRSEGLGLTILEAMARAKPIVSTSYGGVTDFVSAETSFVIDHCLTEVGEGQAPYRPYFVWADPQKMSLQKALRRVFMDNDAGREIGSRAQALVGELFSLRATADALAGELERIRHAAH